MYTAIIASGDYIEISAQSENQAVNYILLKYTTEEIKAAEIEIVKGYGENAETIWSFENL